MYPRISRRPLNPEVVSCLHQGKWPWRVIHVVPSRTSSCLHGLFYPHSILYRAAFIHFYVNSQTSLQIFQVIRSILHTPIFARPLGIASITSSGQASGTTTHLPGILSLSFQYQIQNVGAPHYCFHSVLYICLLHCLAWYYFIPKTLRSYDDTLT